MICEDEHNDFTPNTKLTIDFNIENNYLENLIFYAPPPGVPELANLQTDGIFYNLTKSQLNEVPITAVNRCVVSATVNDIFLTYLEYDDIMILYKNVNYKYTEIYSVNIPIVTTNAYPYVFKTIHTIPHDIGSFAFMFRRIDNNTNLKQNNTHTIYDNFDINNYTIKYGNTSYPTTISDLNFKRYSANGVKTDNNNFFKQFVNQTN